MRRILALVVVVVFAVGLLAYLVITAREDKMPPMAREAVSEYLRARTAPTGTAPVLLGAVRAHRPDRFDAAYSLAAFSNALYFRTSRGYAPELAGVPLPGLTPGPAEAPVDSGLRALPYPPAEVWCLLLAQEGWGSRVAYAALHQDLYNAQWVIHEAAGDAGEAVVRSRLDAIACDLGLAP